MKRKATQGEIIHRNLNKKIGEITDIGVRFQNSTETRK